MEVNIRDDEAVGVTVLNLKGELDLYEAQEFKAQIKLLIEEGVRKMIVNMNDLKYIDSSGIGALISGLQQMYKSGGKFKLSAISKDVKRSFDLANLSRLFEIHRSKDEALKSFH